MADIEKTLKISAPISPYSTSDSYPTHLSIFGKGGMKSVQSIAERNAIPEERREEGMLVYVVADKKIYGLRGGISNTDWCDIRFIVNGENAGQIIVSISAPENPTESTLWFNPSDGNIYSRNIANNTWIQYVPPLVDGGEF